MAEILLGVSGGIAAYRALEAMRLLQRRGHAVTVVMTRAATKFVAPASFAALSGRPVGLELLGDGVRPGYDHLELARGADLLLVAPASANTLARMAAGLADGLLGAVYLAFTGPVLVAPAMNTRMWEHPASRDNLERLRGRGVQVVPPGTGLLADGEVGVGRLAEPEAIADAVDARLAAGPASALAGRRVVVSAGGTREPLDAVRYLGNRSSGRMGLALAAAARRRGADVTLIASNLELPAPPDVSVVQAPTAADLHRAVLAAVTGADVVVMAAAVADYRPVAADRHAGKIDKGAAAERSVRLERTEDVLADVAARRAASATPGRPLLVGFAAEHGAEGLERARAKRARKGVELLVHNDVSEPGIGFGADENAVTILDADGGAEVVPRAAKSAVAERILDRVEALLGDP